MRRIALAAFGLVLLTAQPASADTYARVSATRVTLGNELVERTWRRDALVTEQLVDKRGGGRTWSKDRRDFALDLVGRTDIGSERLAVTGAKVTKLARGGLRVTMSAGLPGVLDVTRVAEVYPGVAGFRTQTILKPATGLVLSSATLDEAATGPGTTTVHAFRAGSDWREPD
jgi:hypothetical protein